MSNNNNIFDQVSYKKHQTHPIQHNTAAADAATSTKLCHHVKKANIRKSQYLLRHQQQQRRQPQNQQCIQQKRDPLLMEQRFTKSFEKSHSVPSLYRRLTKLLVSYRDMFLACGYSDSHHLVEEINAYISETKKHIPISRTQLIMKILYLEDHIFMEATRVQYPFDLISWVTIVSSSSINEK